MLPEEATHRAIQGHRKAVAHALGISLSLAGAHCAPPQDRDGDGRRSPAEGVIIQHHTLDEKGERERALGLIRYVARECGGVFLQLDRFADPASLDTTAEIVKEFGDLLTRTAAALQDNRLSAAEAETILPEAEDVIAILLPFLRALEGVIVEDEVSRERVRKGPRRVSRLSELRAKSIRISA